MSNFIYDFHLFARSDQEQYTPLRPNWTGQDPTTYADSYTSVQDLSPEMKTFYDKNLIRLAEPELVHDQFGQKRPIPGGNGKTIITATIEQYGGYITLSDMLNLTAYDNNMQEVMKLLASQAGQVSDKITRDILAEGTNVSYAGAATGRVDDTGVVGLTSADVLTIEDIKKAVRKLKRVNAKTIGGNFVAIVHPDVAYDLMNDSEWIDANQYAGSTAIFNGEIGKMYGVRFVETTMAKIWVTTGGLPVYGTLVLAENAFGVTSINNGGIETIVKQLGSGGTADPLNQRSTVGWKLNKVAKILEQSYMVRIESAASFGSTAEAN